MRVLGRITTPNLASAPSSPTTGELYFNTTANKLYWWNGTSWIDATGGGGGGGSTSDAFPVPSSHGFLAWSTPPDGLSSQGRTRHRAYHMGAGQAGSGGDSQHAVDLCRHSRVRVDRRAELHRPLQQCWQSTCFLGGPIGSVDYNWPQVGGDHTAVGGRWRLSDRDSRRWHYAPGHSPPQRFCCCHV